MANNYIDLPVEGGAAGVTSLNGQTGALTLVAGANITITPGSGTLTIAATGTGGGSIGAINTLQTSDGAGGFQTLSGQVSASRQISTNYTLNPDTDLDLYVDVTGGPITVTLPVGVDGQEFYVQDALGQASASNITFLTSGSDIFAQTDPTINNDFGTRRWIFKTITFMAMTFGVWYYEDDAMPITITGDPNTVAFFNNSGILIDDVSFVYDETDKSIKFGDISGGGVINVSSASLAYGLSDGTIQSVDSGSLTFGFTDIGSTILNNSSAGFTAGFAGSSGIIQSIGSTGALAYGTATNSGELSSAGIGSVVIGQSDGVGSALQALGNGSQVFGLALTGGAITANTDGSTCLGRASNGGVISTSNSAALAGGFCDGPSTIVANNSGAIVYGTSVNSGQMQASHIGSAVFGSVDGAGSFINSINTGAMAFGDCASGSTVEAGGHGSLAFGYANQGGVIATNDGSLAFGVTTSGSALSISANGTGALAFGNAIAGGIQAAEAGTIAGGDDIVADSLNGQAFGQGHRNMSAFTAIFGRYAVTTPTNPTVWADTDPLFVLGNGVDDSTRNNALTIRKDGLPGLDAVITPTGTTGDQTINKASGTVNFAIATITLTVTNSLVDTNSLVFCTIRTNDATAVIKNVVPASGSFTINLTAATAGETSVGFIVIGQAN